MDMKFIAIISRSSVMFKANRDEDHVMHCVTINLIILYCRSETSTPKYLHFLRSLSPFSKSLMVRILRPLNGLEINSFLHHFPQWRHFAQTSDMGL